MAAVFRRLAYSYLIGAAEWPPTFRAPQDQTFRPAPSGNIYVHLPFCETFCPHCPYNKAHCESSLVDAYQGALIREIEDYRARQDVLPVHTLYFGGGTPTLTPQTIRAAIDAFRPLLTPNAEVAVEAYPSHATLAQLKELRAMGVNRLSLGIESLNPTLLKRLGRRYYPEEALSAMEHAKTSGFDMFDVNLILGIPGQSTEEFCAGVSACIEAGVDQISAYPLFTFDHTPAGRARHAGLFAKADDFSRLKMQRSVSRMTRAAGFRRTSVWSYTREDISAYTTVTRPDYVGFGAGAGSKAEGLAAFNTFSVSAYINATPYSTALIYQLSRRQQKADWLYWQVYNTRIDRQAYETQFGVPLERDFGMILNFLRMLGLLKRHGVEYVLTETGAIWVHRIQSLFSLNGIDAMWTACQKEPWPNAVAIA